MKELLVKKAEFGHVKVFGNLKDYGTGNRVADENLIDVVKVLSGDFGIPVETPVFLLRSFYYNLFYGGNACHDRNKYRTKSYNCQPLSRKKSYDKVLYDKMANFAKMSDIRTRLKLLRKTLGLSQSQFAHKLGVSKDLISKYEQGRRSVPDKTLRLISKTFGVSYEWLKYGKGEMWAEKEEEIPPDAPLDRELFYKIMSLVVKAIREGKLTGISDEELLELVKLLYKKYKPLKDKEESQKLWKELEQDVVILGKTLEKK